MFATLTFFVLTAQAATVRLPVKFHKQERELSCEAAALVTVLRFHGVQVSEKDVIAKMPFDRTPKKGGVWGDPDVGFVGDIDGVMGETGYGIHWNPIARLAKNWKDAATIENGTLAELTKNLDEGRPVIVWGLDGPGREMKWQTPKGRKISALYNEHTRVVIGYKGSKEQPVSFDVLDPRLGEMRLTTPEFLKDWNSFGRKGVVVYR
ncbi:MAG: C39 family peptidase [Bdellovibrionia bacterium]